MVPFEFDNLTAEGFRPRPQERWRGANGRHSLAGDGPDDLFQAGSRGSQFIHQFVAVLFCSGGTVQCSHEFHLQLGDLLMRFDQLFRPLPRCSVVERSPERLPCRLAVTVPFDSELLDLISRYRQLRLER